MRVSAAKVGVVQARERLVDFAGGAIADGLGQARAIRRQEQQAQTAEFS
jgi:hypothetical protein